jgi:hypothetical protein
MAGAVWVGVAEVELVEEGLPCIEAELVLDCEVVERLEEGLDLAFSQQWSCKYMQTAFSKSKLPVNGFEHHCLW